LVTDWCRCPNGRLIDLSDDAFRQLAPLSSGIIGVEITRVVHVALPPTDALP
jgi:rare lipoprotein A (peptidoglycan hydrolase)